MMKEDIERYAQEAAGTPADLDPELEAAGIDSWLASEKAPCIPIEVPGAVPGWGCCACLAKEGEGTFNANHRATCKHCGHPRCDVKH